MKKFLLAALLLLLPSSAFAANTCTYTGAGGANASDVTNWSGCGGVAPTTGDTVIIDGAFPVTGNDNLTWDITAAIASINTTGYSGVVTASVTMTVSSGDITFANGTFAHGNQEVVLAGTKTVTPGNNSFYKLTMNNSAAAVTITLGGDITVVNTLDLNANSGGSAGVWNGNNLFAQGNVSKTAASTRVSGTTVLNFTGGANQTWTSGTGYMELPVVINKSANTLTLSGTLPLSNTFTYTAGTVSSGTSTVNLDANGTISSTWTTNGMSFNNLAHVNFFAATITLGSNMAVGGNLELNNSSGGSAGTWTGAYTISVTGNVSNTAAATVTLGGGIGLTITGNWSIPAGTINAGSGTHRVRGNFTNAGTFTKQTSTVIFDGGSTSTIDGSTDFYSFTCSSGTTCSFDDADTFTTAAAGVFSGDGTFASDHAANTVDFNVAGSETVGSGVCTRVDNSGTNVSTSGTITSCTGWSTASSRKRILLTS